MKKKMVTLGLCLSVLFNATAAVCSAAPNEVLDKDGIEYVMSGFKGYYLEDGVYYLKQTTNEFGKPIKGADEYRAAVEIPPGEYYASLKLQALSATYPEGKFAVRFRADDGSKMLSEPESEATLKELDRLRNAGVDADIIQETPETAYSTYIFAVLTADQINNFPVSEEFGYRLALSEKPEGSYDSSKLHAEDDSQKKGDVNGDKVIDVGDLSYLSLYLLGDKPLPEEWLKAADVDGDGKVTLADLARLRQFLSKKIVSFDDETPSEPVTDPAADGYDFTAKYCNASNRIVSKETAVFNSEEELKSYLEQNPEKMITLNDETNYDAEWFKNHNLVMVLLNEPYLEFEHEVTYVDSQKIKITRLKQRSVSPMEKGWAIFIELDKDSEMSSEKIDVVITDKEVDSVRAYLQGKQ